MRKSEICFDLGLLIGIVACKLQPKLIYDTKTFGWILAGITIAILLRELLKKKPDK